MRSFTRMNLTLVTRGLDVILMVAMAYMPTKGETAGHVLVALHLLRSACANASRPLLRSVLMDNGAHIILFAVYLQCHNFR